LHKEITTSFAHKRLPYLLLANYNCIEAPEWPWDALSLLLHFVRGYSSGSVKLNAYAYAEPRLRIHGSLLSLPLHLIGMLN
jgi:hypothetical protein